MNALMRTCDTGWRYQLSQQVEFVVILLLLKCYADDGNDHNNDDGFTIIKGVRFKFWN